MQEIINRVAEFLKKYNLQDKTVIVGFSGGFDSMCLLDILSKIKELPDFYDLNVIAAHFNHNWRGQESLREQEVCRVFASAKGVDLYTKTASKKNKKTYICKRKPMVVTRLRGDRLPFFSSFPTAPELQKTQTMPCNFSPFSVSKSNPNLQPNEKSSTLSDAFAYRAHDKHSASPRTGYAGTAAALCLPERHPQ